MSHPYSLASRCVLLAAMALPSLPQARLQTPVRELTGSQESAVGGSGFIEIQASSSNFRTAAMINVKNDANGSRTAVDRGNNAISAVYSGVSLPNALPSTPPAAVSSAPPVTQIYDFKTSGDSAQGWATMQANGMPFLLTRAFGKATASGTATWAARVYVPVSQTNMYVRFTLPQVQVRGENEFDGPSRYQSRFRADLLLNGHPVWNSEAIRFNEFNGNPGYCNVKSELKTRFQSFGTAPLSLSATDKNDTSSLNEVTVSLGSFAANQALDLSLVVRADTVVESKCCNQDGELFCTGATTRVDWNSVISAPVRFWAGPAI
jgi:hypothetical protein